jgi:hypothetical protein
VLHAIPLHLPGLRHHDHDHIRVVEKPARRDQQNGKETPIPLDERSQRLLEPGGVEAKPVAGGLDAAEKLEATLRSPGGNQEGSEIGQGGTLVRDAYRLNGQGQPGCFERSVHITAPPMDLGEPDVTEVPDHRLSDLLSNHDTLLGRLVTAVQVAYVLLGLR